MTDLLCALFVGWCVGSGLANLVLCSFLVGRFLASRFRGWVDDTE
jgi:hypothetical protein